MNLREWCQELRAMASRTSSGTLFKTVHMAKSKNLPEPTSQDFHFQSEDLWMTSLPGALQRPIRIQHLPWFPAVNVDFEVTKSAAEASYEKSSWRKCNCGPLLWPSSPAKHSLPGGPKQASKSPKDPQRWHRNPKTDRWDFLSRTPQNVPKWPLLIPLDTHLHFGECLIVELGPKSWGPDPWPPCLTKHPNNS